MLRDFPYTVDAYSLRFVFDQFDLKPPENLDEVALLQFKMLTPDSFIWKFLIGDGVYYLYLEDFVESLESVKSKIKQHTKNHADFTFVEVKKQKPFREADPVKATVSYQTPSNTKEMMKYAADAEIDFAFLVRSNEDIDDARFE